MNKYIRLACFILILTTVNARSGMAQAPANPPDPGQGERLAREVERYYSLLARSEQSDTNPGGFYSAAGARGTAPNVNTVAGAGAWWTNASVLSRLALTEEQKAKIEKAFENHRQAILNTTSQLEKEEAQLAKLLAAETLERNAILGQIDRVVQARGEVERVNSAMTLEMREYLTRAQWLQLQPSQRLRVGAAIASSQVSNRVTPVYPEAAKQARVEGVVILEVDVSKEGLVENIRVMSGQPQLIQAAVDAVKQWRYRPTLLNGQPTAIVTMVNLNFSLSQGVGTAPATTGAGRGGRGQQ